MYRLIGIAILTGLFAVRCADANFSGTGGVKALPPPPECVKSATETCGEPPAPPPDITPPVVDKSHQCIMQATGTNVTSVQISGENCINNTVDAGGADKNDFLVTISGDLMRSGWEFFSNKDQDIAISYNLGSPGSTTQIVSLQIVDCDKVKQVNFDVSSGSGKTTLKAKRGDRFNIVTTVTSGCYGRKNEFYDMLLRKQEAFMIH